MLPGMNEVVTQFLIPGTLIGVRQIKRGHINDTYVSEWENEGVRERYIHQRINHKVFPDVEGLMRNVERVISHVRSESLRLGYRDEVLTLVSARAGGNLVYDSERNPWRTYLHIANVESIDVCSSPQLARESACAFSRFQRCLLTLPAQELTDVIPRFHDAWFRLDALREVVESDPAGRVAGVSREIDFAMQRREGAGVILTAIRDGEVPVRATHNDLKLNNVLFRTGSQQAIAVVDLDTCMPGSVLYDFGDLARCTAVPCAEDEPNLARVQVDQALYRGLLEGYISELRDDLAGEELALFSAAPTVLALTLGVRFLTDYLQGDTYFKTAHPEHNLQRARTQFAISERFEALAPVLAGMVQ